MDGSESAISPPVWRSRPNPYLAPPHLEVEDVGPRRVLIVGGCFMIGWPDHLARAGVEVQFDRYLFHNMLELPTEPPHPVAEYDFQLVQTPLGSVAPDNEYVRLPYDDLDAHERYFHECVARMELGLRQGMTWSDRVLTFAPNYLSPQVNLMGRLMPRYDLRNPVYLVERLNAELDRILREQYPAAHLVDVNHIASVCGRRYLQEDVLWPQLHGGFINMTTDRLLDGSGRLERSPPPRRIYDFADDEYVATVWLEVRAAYRTLKGVDQVKMVCVDLDDTLWRGVAAEKEAFDLNDRLTMTLGWPLGVIEALLYLKKRGVILAVVSRNDLSRITAIWDEIFQGRLRMDDFAIVKIDWEPKPQNIAAAISEANLLPRSVVFLDDNPVERAAVTSAIPEIRAISASQYEWRRILAWSAETQVAAISEESGARTQMVRAQVGREQVRATMTRDEFLSSLELTLALVPVRDAADPRFPRALELANKTNQFNTTGRRWSAAEATDYLAAGGVWWTFKVADRFTRYGVVGVVAVRGRRIDQFVMSCRVAGLDVERAALAAILDQASPGDAAFEGVVEETGSNAVVRDLFARLGWKLEGELWVGVGAPAAPSHVRMTA